MVSVNQNYFTLNFDYFTNITRDNSWIENIKNYIKLLKRLYDMKKILKNNFNHFDAYIFMNNLNSIEKIDEILLNLEDLTEFSNETLQSTHLKSWSHYPVFYLLDKIEDWNIALQGLLLSKQAHLL